MDDDYVFVSRPDEAPSQPEPTTRHLAEIDRFIAQLEPALWPLNCFIHDNPELGYKEFKTHDALTKFMKCQSGWTVTPSAYGMATAWEAVFDTGRPGPVVSFNAEMDALPNLGHACGHNLIAMVSVAAGLATAEILDKQGLAGKVVIVGTPAEEGGGGKIKCLQAGAYKNTDVSMISHPGILNNSPMVRTTAFTGLHVEYRGTAAHSAKNPWQGVNALDAVVVAYTAVSAMRQQTRADDFVGLQITHGGDRPNIIHERAAAAAVLRAATAPHLRELQAKVEGCMRAGAEATGARAHIRVRPGYLDHMPNRVLAASYAKYWAAMPSAPDPPLPPPGQYTWVRSSTDQGNLSYALPSMNVSFAIPPGPEAGQPHSPDFEKASRTRGAFDRAMRVAKAMAGTAVDMYTVPGLLQEVKEQWKRDMNQD
ncbi:peptidase dimerization domain protein [Cordyceps fumosorosea ARSEF 2679]|uniref:Peptidase M20 domain-containing protein 2 n=1 Tax=Cordyceps fumosorosea (strain ARSEF 2679) TaxID=1081104 RepID=A0A167MS93_CORFA|nr:peptidase dimerization domain protein [Cordyceps fumosorosea ARSEF 2679]OAA54698.1 peptidase dimerization domain protein [Cordyceps fumosorosea ARSEF 2679]